MRKSTVILSLACATACSGEMFSGDLYGPPPDGEAGQAGTAAAGSGGGQGGSAGSEPDAGGSAGTAGGSAGAQAGSGGTEPDAGPPDAKEPDADACGGYSILAYCGVCPTGTHPTAITDPGQGGCPHWLRNCEPDCGTFAMCSITAPCPAGWVETGTVSTTGCVGGGATKPNGDNAIICEPVS